MKYSVKLSHAVHILVFIYLSEGLPLSSDKIAEGDKTLLHLDTHTNPECGIGVNIQLALQSFYDKVQKDAENSMAGISLSDIIRGYYQRIEKSEQTGR